MAGLSTADKSDGAFTLLALADTFMEENKATLNSDSCVHYFLLTEFYSYCSVHTDCMNQECT